MLRDIAVNESSTMRWNFQQDVVKYAAGGVNKMGVCRGKVSDFGYDDAVDLLFEMEMGVSSVNWAGGFTGSDGRTFVEAVEDAKQAVRFSSHVGADCLIVHSGGINGHTDRHARRIFEHALDAILPLAEDFGVTVALEPMVGSAGKNWSILPAIEQTVALVNQYSSAHLGLVLDLFHCGLHERAVPLFQANADKVAVIQVADRTIGNRRQRCMPGLGSVRIRHWLESMCGAGVQCAVELEVYGENSGESGYQEKLQSFEEYLLRPEMALLRQEPKSEAPHQPSRVFKD